MLLGRHNGAAFFSHGQNRILVQRLHRVHVHHSGPDALRRQQVSGLQRLGHHQAHGDDGHVAALAHDVRLSGHKGRALVGEAFAHRARHADIHRAFDGRGRAHGLAHLNGVAGHEDRHIGHHAHQGDVLYALVAAAVLAHAQAGMGKAELHIGVHIRDGIADLLVSAARAEQRERADEGDQPLVGKARGRAGHVGDAEIKKAVRIHRGKAVGHGGVGKVRVQHDDLVVLRAQLGQRLAVGNTQGFALSHCRIPPVLSSLAHTAPCSAPCRASPPGLP